MYIMIKKTVYLELLKLRIKKIFVMYIMIFLLMLTQFRKQFVF